MNDSPSEDTVRALKHVSDAMECLHLSDISELNVPKEGALQIYVCAYAINLSCFIEGSEDILESPTYLSFQTPAVNKYIPFLQWIVEKSENEYNFPTFSVDCFGEENTVRDECILRILDSVLAKDTPLHGDDFTDCCKGFIRQDDSIYVVFDLTQYKEHAIMSDIRKWAIVDELVYKKSVLGVPIAKNVADFMGTHDCLLQTAEGQELPFPFQVYLCKKDDNGEYRNVDVNDSEHENDFYMEVDEMGYGYVFTTEPSFVKDGKTENLQRYAMFVVNCFYDLPLNGQMGGASPTQEQKTTTKTKTTKTDSHTNSFFKGAEDYIVGTFSKLNSNTLFDSNQNASVAIKPEESAIKPEESAIKPEESATKPEESATKPEESATKPEESATKPDEETNIVVESDELVADEESSHIKNNDGTSDVIDKSLASTVYFVKDNIQMWIVRNVIQFSSY